MFSLSTSWNAFRHKSGRDLIREIRALGFDTVELSFALPLNMVNDILDMRNSGEISVSSLHNMCPLPEEIEPDEASPDYYSLASTDDKERELAVDAAKKTLLYAHRIGAGAVVLHAGRVQMKDRTRELASLVTDKEAFAVLKNEMITERRRLGGEYLNNVIKSLKQIVPYSLDMGVKIGLETRYYYREIPQIDEFGEIFSHFKENELFYWHDAGHAEVFSRLGFTRHEDFLKRYSSRLIGVHLHDIIGIMGDHNAPGTGTMDFSILKPYIKKDTIKVIEAHDPAPASAVKNSAAYLAGIIG